MFSTCAVGWRFMASQPHTIRNRTGGKIICRSFVIFFPKVSINIVRNNNKPFRYVFAEISSRRRLKQTRFKRELLYRLYIRSSMYLKFAMMEMKQRMAEKISSRHSKRRERKNRKGKAVRKAPLLSHLKWWAVWTSIIGMHKRFFMPWVQKRIISASMSAECWWIIQKSKVSLNIRSAWSCQQGEMLKSEKNTKGRLNAWSVFIPHDTGEAVWQSNKWGGFFYL